MHKVTFKIRRPWSAIIYLLQRKFQWVDSFLQACWLLGGEMATHWQSQHVGFKILDIWEDDLCIVLSINLSCTTGVFMPYLWEDGCQKQWWAFTEYTHAMVYIEYSCWKERPIFHTPAGEWSERRGGSLQEPRPRKGNVSCPTIVNCS